MAQLNDLLVLGYTNLLGTVNVFGEILADTFNGKFKGNGSLITNINAENISSGTLPVSRGGTGLASVTANSILAGNGSSSFKSIGTASGALYATADGGAAKFGTLPVAQGGSGATTFTSNAVLTGNGTGAFKAVASASGALYATAANGAPVFGTLPVAQGGTGRTSWTAYSLVYASAAGALSSLSTGTSGYVLQSGGSSAAPSWINATNASTANTIVKRDANGGFSAGVIEAKVKKIAINGIDTATEYGDYGGIIQSSSDGPNSSQWHNSIKILHTNTSDHYYTQLAQQFTGQHGLWHRSMRSGVLSDWYKVMDIVVGGSKGSATKPIYIDKGAWAECSTYAGGSRVKLNDTEYPGSTATFYAPTSTGTSGQVLVSSGGAPSWSGIAAVKKTTAAIEGNRTAAGDISALYLYGPTYGNTASNLATAGQMSYGDPGPQIIFNTGNISSPGSQAAALIFTDHDTIASGTSLSLVSNQGSVSFIAPTIKALTKFIGTLDGNASSATKLANARTINGTSFNGTKDITTLNWGTARDITIGDTKRSVNGSQAYTWNSTDIGYRHEWKAIVKGVTWSRLCHVAAGAGVIGSKFILNIGATRGNVVYNDAYLITAHHHSNGKIVKLAGHNYSSGYEVRLLSNSNGDCYVELYDNLQSITNASTQEVQCRLIPIFCGTITKYTTFTSGATVPSDYTIKQTMKLDTAAIQADSINPISTGSGSVGSDSNKWNAMYANTFNGVATQINVNNSTPTSETKYYPLYVNDVSGGQQVKANADFYYYDSGTWSSLNVGSGTNKGILSLHNSNKYVNLDPAALTANRSITIRDMDGYLGLATQYEYNKELSMGQTGKVCIGKFPMYDSNVTVRISSTTSSTYNGTLVIATQNINTSGGGTYKAVVYGDEYNNLASSIKIHYGSGSNVFSVYIDLPGWSKNLVHVQCVGLTGAPTDVLTSVSSIPSTATITPTHVLSTATHVNSANSATIASKLNVSAGDIGQAIYFSGGQPAAIDWRIGNKDVGEHNANNVTYNFSGYYTSNGPATTLGAQTNDGSLWAQAYNSTWVTQIAQDYRDGQLFVRSKNNGTWQAWKGIPMLTAKSVGSSTQPVYVNDSGVITACTAYSGLFTGMSWSNRTLSLTVGGTTKTADIPTNLSGFNRISLTTTDNTTGPTGQSIVLNGVDNNTTVEKAPGIGFHIGGKDWGSLKFLSDGTFRFYNSTCSGYKDIYANKFYGTGAKFDVTNTNLQAGRAYPAGESQKYCKVATFTQSISSAQINTALTMLVTGFYSTNNLVNGILKVEARYTVGSTTPEFVNLRWLTANSNVVPANFIITHQLSSNTATLNLYVYLPSSWSSVNFTKLSEHNWGGSDGQFGWTFLQATSGSAYILNAIPSGETQVESVLTDIKNNAATASSAVKATQDSDGNTIKTTYLKLSGGTMTGNINFKTTNYTSTPLSVVDDGTTYGHTLLVGAGGTTYIGAGESASTLYNTKLGIKSTEDLILGADSNIRFYTNADNATANSGVLLNTANTFYPLTTNTGSLGASSNYWGSLYATTGNVSTIYATNWFRSYNNTGWYNQTHGGGIYMQDSTYVRTYGSKAFYVDNTGDHAIYTAGGFATARTSGSLFASYYNSTWYKDTLYNHGNGNLSINPPGGHTYISYNRGNTYFGGGTYCIDREGYFNGTAATATRISLNGIADGTNYGTYGGIIQDSSTGPESGSWHNSIKILHSNSNKGWYTQLAQNFTGTEGLWHRSYRNGVQGSWHRVLDSNCYNSYAPKLDGTGATGTWSININGNAATASYLTNITSTDVASNSATQRYVFISYNDLTTNRPAYDTNFTYQTSTGTLSTPKIKISGISAPTASGGTTYGTGSSGQVLKSNGSGGVYWASDSNSNTKNTAGATDSSSKLFLVGATEQSANPQTYTHDTAYVGTDGCLYSGGTKVSVSGHTHSYLPLSGGTMTGVLTLKKDVYDDAASTGALNVNNSNIYGINALYWADNASNRSEGINFIRTNGKLDTLWINDGVIYFEQNRDYGAAGTQNIVLHSGNWSSYITGTDKYVQQSRTTTASWRSVLSHYTNTDYATDPTAATNITYYNEAIAIQPSTGTLKASILTSTGKIEAGSYLKATTYVYGTTYVRAGTYLRSGNYGTAAPTTSTAGATTAGAIYFQIVS